MAGNYPDPPGHRLAYDRDGTLGFARWGTTAVDVLGTPITTANLKAMNDENTLTSHDAGYFASASSRWLIFPTPRDISHIHHHGEGVSNLLAFQWSANTTNGIDGTWNSVTVTNQANSRMAMRTAWNATPSILNAKSLRWQQNGGGAPDPRTRTLHLYGKPTVPGDRLEFWHPTLDQPLRDTPAYLDWGDRPRGTTATKQVRVKNRSGFMSANSIVLGAEALTDAAPSFVPQHTFSLDGGPFATTLNLPNLAPGQVSSVIAIKQDLQPDAVVSLWDLRLFANVGTWA